MKSAVDFLKYLNAKPKLKISALVLICLLIFIPHLFISYNIYKEALMPDLHARIVGSRLMDLGRSPFFFSWKPGYDYRLISPNNALPRTLTGVTATPFYLWLQIPLSRLDYCTIKFIWWILQEVLLLGTFILSCLIPVKLLKQLTVISISTIFFLYSRNWYVHVYSGQYYVIFGFIFSLVSYFVVQRRKAFSSLIIFPYITLLRPFFALAALPWFLIDVKKRITHVIAPVILCIVLFFVSGGIKIWKDYNYAMKMYSSEITGMTLRIDDVNLFKNTAPLEECVEQVSSFKVFGAGCLFSFQHYLNLFNTKWNNPLLFSGFLLITVSMFVLMLGQKRLYNNEHNLLLSSFLVYILCELFTPANRNPYNLIQYLGILGVFIDKANYKLIALMVFGLALNHDFPIRLAYQRELGEMIILLAIFIALFRKALSPDNSTRFLLNLKTLFY